MADVAQMTEAPQGGEDNAWKTIKFKGSRSQMAVGVALAAAGGIAFMMGMTDVFFAKAWAWVFVIWGALFIYVGLIDDAEVFEVTDDALIIRNPMRPFSAKKVWPWEGIKRMEVVVKHRDARDEDATMRVYYLDPDDPTIEREDREYAPALARLIIERSGLKPDDDNVVDDLERLPPNQTGIYVWKK